MGLFWGAPLIAREVADGTHRIAWNQSVTRTRWTIVKLGLIGLAAVATAGLLSLIVTWWASPIDAASLAGGSAQAGTGGNGVHITFNGFGRPGSTRSSSTRGGWPRSATRRSPSRSA